MRILLYGDSDECPISFLDYHRHRNPQIFNSLTKFSDPENTSVDHHSMNAMLHDTIQCPNRPVSEGTALV